METKFDVKLTTKDMFNFYLYHMYTRASGIFSIVLSLVILYLLVTTYADNSSTQNLFYVVFLLLFLVYSPFSLWLKAKRQVSSPMFKEAIMYQISDSGIKTLQKKESAEIKWEDIMTVKSTGRSLIVYVNKIRAYVLPKNCMGEQYNQVVTMIKKNMEPNKVKLK